MTEWASESDLPSMRKSTVEKHKIALPPIKVQEHVVAQIEEEQKLVDANKKLIEISERKIKKEIEELWGT